MLPFSAAEFFSVFAAYNVAIWPTQLILVALALTAVFLASRRPIGYGRGVFVILAGLWTWSGAAYHVAFFSEINPGAWAFGGLFLAQGAAFAWMALHHPGSFQPGRDVYGFSGGGLVVYALLIYPAIGMLAGHVYPASPTFGAPCPVTIFTFGVLLWFDGRVPGRLLWIPLLWSLVGTSAAVSFGLVEDLGLPVAALLASWLLLRREPRRAEAAPEPQQAAVPLPR